MTPELLQEASQRVVRCSQLRMNGLPEKSLLGMWARSLLLEHVVAERDLSRNTQGSYRGIPMLLLLFARASCGRRIDRMTIEDLFPTVVRRFLDHYSATI